MRVLTAMIVVAAALAGSADAKPTRAPAGTADTVCASCVREHMQQLANEAARGRECATADEARAARYIQGELALYGVRGAFGGDYLQPVALSTPRLAAPPRLQLGNGPQWTHGAEFLVRERPQTVSGPLISMADPAAAAPASVKGAVVFYDADKPTARGRRALFAAGAVAVIEPASPAMAGHWSDLAEMWRRPEVVGAQANPADGDGPRLSVLPEQAAMLRRTPAGARVALTVQTLPPQTRATQNVVGVVHGSAPDADRKAVLLSAHYDHLGVRDGVLFPGADDDASGTAAVLEFARMLGKGPRPRRTVYFALFGCEEEGGLGARYFRSHPPTRLGDLAANLEFEMIGLRDPKHPDELMLTGWERSNLGPVLKAHGARIGPDPYPEENFFMRSDNYELALKGVVAQTTSGWPNPPSYHQPSDDLKHVDTGFMVQVIQSFAGPVRWLLDSDFTPQWNPGQKP